MSLHDAYARLTPVEIAFPDPARVERLSGSVAAESEERGVDDTDPDVFVTLRVVAERVRTLRGPEEPVESTYPFGSLLFQCVHFTRAGCPVYLLKIEAARRLLEDAPGERRPAGEPKLQPPQSAGYLQLPQHLVWTRDSEGGTPESLDGIFWTLSKSGMLHVLAISGLRPDRPGFGASTLPAAPASEVASWLDATVRASGRDFASGLPGAELDRLYAVERAGEVLKLLARFFAHLSTGGAPLEVGRIPESVGRGPRPTAMHYTRVAPGD